MTKNRLRTSHESSMKPSDHTLQHGALYFWLFHENGCVKCWILFFVIIGGFFAKWTRVFHCTSMVQDTTVPWEQKNKKVWKYRGQHSTVGTQFIQYDTVSQQILYQKRSMMFFFTVNQLILNRCKWWKWKNWFQNSVILNKMHMSGNI